MAHRLASLKLLDNPCMIKIKVRSLRSILLSNKSKYSHHLLPPSLTIPIMLLMMEMEATWMGTMMTLRALSGNLIRSTKR